MKLTFPCEFGDREYDSEKNGSVRCESLMNDRLFSCPHIKQCMCRVEDEICGCLSNKPMHIIETKEPTQKELIKEFVSEPIPEFAEAV